MPTSIDAGRLEACAPGSRDLLEEMCTLWSASFERPVRATDDFFDDLEGDSLLAVQLVSRMRRRFGVTVPLAVFFDEPSPAGMALAVVQLRGAVDG